MLENRLIRLIVSLVITVVFMGLLVLFTPPSDASRIAVMLGGTMPEGMIQGLTYFLFVFGVLELYWISNKITHERDAFTLHILPEKENWVLSADDVNKLKLNVQQMERSNSFYLLDLVKKCCTKYRLGKSSSEVLDLAEAQMRIYQSNMESEQSFIRYVAWAIPSVGFIGTVLGIAGSLGYAKDAATQAGIEKVTSMLAVAFDTTLIALVLSVFLMYGVHSVQKKQEQLFSSMSDYLIENLINRFYK